MESKMQYTIENVIALWPRINKTYKFDSIENRSVPCEASDPMAAYEMSFEMTQAQAKALWGEMLKAYDAKKQTGWPDKPTSPFKKTEDGTVTAKAKLKGNYGGDLTKKPLQVDAQNVKLADDFMLTTGSKVHIAVTFVPYNMREAGVSMRLRAVQVIEYKEPMEEQSPFGSTAGFTAPAQDDPFGLPAETPAAPVNDLDDEIPF